MYMETRAADKSYPSLSWRQAVIPVDTVLISTPLPARVLAKVTPMQPGGETKNIGPWDMTLEACRWSITKK